jgi:hypothetical protein
MFSKFFREKSFKTVLQTKKFLSQTKNIKKTHSNFLKFSCLTISSASALFFFNQEFKSQELFTTNFKKEEFGLEIILPENWSISTTDKGHSEEIIITSPNQTSDDNFSFIFCERIDDSYNLNFEKYVNFSLQELENIGHMNSNLECLNIKNETKLTKFGDKYEDISYEVIDKENALISKIQVFIFFQENAAIVFQSSNEKSSFKNNHLLPLIDNIKLFKPVVNMQDSLVKKFSNSFDGFSFEHPKDWKIQEGYSNGVHQILINKPNNNSRGLVLIERINHVNLDSYVDLGISIIQSMKETTLGQMNVKNLTQKKKYSKSGYEYVEIVYEISYLKDDKISSKIKQNIFFHDGKGFILQTFGSKDDFDEEFMESITDDIKFY